MSALKTDPFLHELEQRCWSPKVTFRARLAALQKLVQSHLDQLPNHPNPYVPRVRATLQLGLGELALVLPPVEKRLLEHIRVRRPLSAILGQPGFRDVRRRDRVVQRLVSRIQYLCGSRVRYRLMMPYDRPGHSHTRRRGHPRVLLPAERIPRLELYVPRWFASRRHRGLKVLEPMKARQLAA